jgi:transglutaminase-like putative cysteine protease
MNCTTKKVLRLSMAAAAVVTAWGASAQQPDRYKYEEIAARYKNEHAVYTNLVHKLTIREEERMLFGHSEESAEKLYISNVSINNWNRDYFSYMGGLVNDLDGVAFLPDSKTRGYKRVNNSHPEEAVSVDRNTLSDSKQYAVSYTGLEKGAISRSSFSIDFAGMHNLVPCNFQRSIPVEKETFEVSAPKNVKMGFLLKGGDTSIIKRSVRERNGMTVYTFTAEHVPAAKNYSGVPSARYTIPHIIPYVISYRATGASKDTFFTASKDDLYKHLYPYVKGLNIKTDAALKKTVAEITSRSYTQRDKAIAIYSWVQKNLHYFGYEQGLEGQIPRPADTVLKREYGDCKDMSSIIMAMCRQVGLNAYFAWIGTDDLPYSPGELPCSMINNHMICALKLGGEWVFLDGTDNHLPFGANRRDVQGKEAMIAIDDKKYEIVKIPVLPASNNVVSDRTIINIANDSITGTVNQHYSGYPAWYIIHNLDYNSKKTEKDKFVRRITSRGSDKYLTSGYSIDAREEGDMDVTVNTDFVVGNYVQQVGKQYIVNMNLKKHYGIGYINDTDRNVPYYLDNVQTIKESVTLNVPAGYRVSYLPKPAQGSVEGVGSYKIAYAEDKKANKVTLTKEYVLSNKEVSPKLFAASNKLADDLSKVYKETVVLTAKR